MDDILRDVVGSHLREQPYEPARCRDMAKDIAEVPLPSRAGGGHFVCPPRRGVREVAVGGGGKVPKYKYQV